MQCSHVQWCPAIHVLDVGVGPCLNQQLHAQSSMMGEGSVMEWSLSTVVESIACHIVVQENVDHYVLAVVAGHVKGSAPKDIDCIRPWASTGRGRRGDERVQKIYIYER